MSSHERSPHVPVASNKRTLIGTIGYHNLTNHSVGPILFEKIIKLPWIDDIVVEELNWGPIAIVQWFEALDKPFERVILFTAINRPERKTGDYTIFKWMGGTPGDQDIQARVGDAVTGVISPENLLIIGEHFHIWPTEVFMLDVEPGSEIAGPELSVEVGERVMEYFEILEDLSKNGPQSARNFANLYGDRIKLAGEE